MKNKPLLALIVASTPDGEIGYKNTIPWRLTGDLPRFKELTMGNVMINGRHTHESLPEVMKDRIRIVISRSPDYVCQVHDPEKGIYGASSIEEALELAHTFNTPMIFFIGGASIYADAMKIVDRAYVTLVHKTAPKYDTVIPNFEFGKDDWVVVNERMVTEDSKTHPQIKLPSHTYYVFERVEKEARQACE